MTERPDDLDVDRALTAWMHSVAPGRAPTRLLEDTFTETMRTRQVRVYPWHRTAPIGGERAATRSRTQLVLGLVALLLVVATAAGLAGGALRPTSTASPDATAKPIPTPAASSGAALPSPLALAPAVRVPVQGPIAIVATDDAVWVLASGRLDRIDPVTNVVVASVPLGSAADLYNGLAAGPGGLWATDNDSQTLYRVDPVGNTVASKIAAGLAPKGVLATADAVWVADVHGGTVLRVDPATNRVATTVFLASSGTSGPNWLASGFGSIWVDVPNAASLVRIDPVTNLVQETIKVPSGIIPCGGIAVTATGVWVTGCSASTVMARIDPSTNMLAATVDLGGSGFNPAVIDGAPWVSVDTGDPTTGRLVRIDEATNTVDRVLIPGTTFGGGGDMVATSSAVWIIDGYHDAVLRLSLAAFAP
ncbi:MAG: hypothetical protein HY264_02920 [Chloroflexi bacterium]|nr:hypothetical protein [Chloroflexota bacterium]